MRYRIYEHVHLAISDVCHLVLGKKLDARLARFGNAETRFFDSELEGLEVVRLFQCGLCRCSNHTRNPILNEAGSNVNPFFYFFLKKIFMEEKGVF